MGKFTPGPWEIVRVHGVPIGVGKRRNSAGIFTDCFTAIGNTLSKNDRDADLPVIEANARLIAAAPDLLEACQAILDRHNYQGTGEPWPELADKVRAAVYKATGEQA